VNKLRRVSVILLLASGLLMLAAPFAMQQPSPALAVESTLAPTETAIPLVTATLLAPSAPLTLPAIDWSDVSLYRKAMKAGFEADVDKFVNANRYQIVAALTFEHDAIIRGAERVRYTNHSTQPLNEIVFRLYPNSPVLSGRMNVTHITIDGTEVKNPTITGLNSILIVPLEQPLAPDSAVELKLDFNVVMARGLDASYGRFGYVHDVISGTAWYPTLSVYEEGSGWWKAMPVSEGDPAFTETGLYDVTMTTPADITIVMSGSEIENVKNPDGTVTHRGVSGPMRDHAFQASQRYIIDSVEVDGTRINAVHYKDPANPNIDGTRNVLKFASTAVATFNKVFGDYPFRDLYVTENPTPTGVEFPGLIQIAESSWIQGRAYLEVVVAHEVGHQWFYSLIGNDQVNHPWLDESLTSYTEFVYMRVAHPEGSTAADYIANKQRQYSGYTGAGQSDMPLDLPVRQYTGISYGLIVYTKGPLFYIELERLLGQDTVYKALNAYFHRYKYAVVTSQDVENTFNEVTGKDLSAVFHKWVGDYTNTETVRK
jgi:hypothetical protein